MRLFQINEDDLRTLETALPQICDLMFERACEPKAQALLLELKEIVSNVRWNYGPPTEMHRLDGPPRGMEWPDA